MMGDDRGLVGGAHLEHEAVAHHREMQPVRPALVADRRERVLLEQVVDRDRALVLDVGARAPDRVLVERDLDEVLLARCRRGAHRRLSRIATERACAASPSASPRAIAAGPGAASCSGPHLSSEVRFMKSNTPSPEEKRAERAVGSTWLEPAT